MALPLFLLLALHPYSSVQAAQAPPEPGHISPVTAAQESRSLPSWSPSALYIASVVHVPGATGGGMVIMERRQGEKRVAAAYLGDDAVVMPPIWSPDGQSVYWVTEGGDLGLLGRDGSSARLSFGLHSPPQCVVLSRDQRTLLALAGGTVRAIPIGAEGRFQVIPLGTLGGGIQWLDLSADGSLVAAVRDGAAWLACDWSGPWHLVAKPEDDGPMSWIRFSPDGRKLALGTENAILISDLASGKIVRLAAAAHDFGDLAWSPDSGCVAVGGDGLSIYGTDGQLLATLLRQPTRWLAWADRSGGPFLAFCRPAEPLPTGEEPSRWVLDFAQWPPNDDDQ